MMRILMLGKYPPIQGGVSADTYWTAQLLAEIGHEVHVVTNAFEVEDAYRINLSADDEKLLTGFKKAGSIKLHCSYIDPKHVYIPQGNPTVSKLVNLALKACDDVRPDLIWASYVEPYGVAALMLSMITSIPYVIKHAGSDIGKLMATDQLRSLYKIVFMKAKAVLTGRSHYERFCHMGVEDGRILTAVSSTVPAELFYPKPMLPGPMTFGCYGKVGKAKGTFALIEAMALAEQRSLPLALKAHWGGRNFSEVGEAVAAVRTWQGVRLDEDMLKIRNYIPHWRIPDFIWSCHAILFPENNFFIPFHTPIVAIESITCGRPVITTEEIAEKNPQLVPGSNCLVVPTNHSAEDILSAMNEAAVGVQNGTWSGCEWPKGRSHESRAAAMGVLLEKIMR